MVPSGVEKFNHQFLYPCHLILRSREEAVQGGYYGPAPNHKPSVKGVCLSTQGVSYVYRLQCHLSAGIGPAQIGLY